MHTTPSKDEAEIQVPGKDRGGRQGRKPISPQYAAAVTEDHEINAGGLIQSVTPLSHVEYWTDSTFVKEAANVVADSLPSLAAPAP